MWRTLGVFNVRGGAEGERQAKAHAERILRQLGIPTSLQEKIEAAVIRATVNAQNPGSLPPARPRVEVRVLLSTTRPAAGVCAPDQVPRTRRKPPAAASRPAGQGWGFFLVEQPGGQTPGRSGGVRHRVDLFLYPEGGLAEAEENGPGDQTF